MANMLDAHDWVVFARGPNRLGRVLAIFGWRLEVGGRGDVRFDQLGCEVLLRGDRL